eukprot:c16655_g1_i1 orf=473-718(-)
MEQHEEDHRGTVSLAAGDGQQQQEDPLADALHALSLNITTFIQAELQNDIICQIKLARWALLCEMELLDERSGMDIAIDGI